MIRRTATPEAATGQAPRVYADRPARVVSALPRRPAKYSLILCEWEKEWLRCVLEEFCAPQEFAKLFTPREAKILELRAIERKTYREIADLFAISTARVGQLVIKARRQLERTGHLFCWCAKTK